MSVAHDLWLVALSLVVAIQGAYVGLSLAVQFRTAAGARRRQLVAASAISLAVAIWSMHFVGMLAAQLPFAVDYLVFPTLLSFLVCVIVVGAGVFAAGAGPLGLGRLVAASCFMGAGIASMHYIGMSALSVCARLEHQPLFVAASVAVGVAASGLALWLANGRGGRLPLFLSAITLGGAIAGMHYTAMAGLLVIPRVGAQTSAPIFSTDLLAIVVSIVAFLVSGVFLLTLMPDRSAQEAERAPVIAIHPDRAGPAWVAAPAAPPEATPDERPDRIPVEREGATLLVPLAEVVAVRANAHYTYIFDGKTELFCPLPIGDIEARLDPTHFVRVHRSHIVNLDRIVTLKRVGDSGVIELDGIGRHTVPVSRSRFMDLKSRLAPKVA